MQIQFTSYYNYFFILLYLINRSKYIKVNFDLCDHWVIYDPLRFEKTVIAVVRIKTVLSCSHIDISFQEISEKSVEPVLMVVKGLTSSFSLAE